MKKCAVVTGSASGMGYETVKRLARDGFDIVADYHTEKPSLNELYASTSSDGYSEAMTAWEFLPARSWTYQLIASRVAPFSQSHHR